MGMQAQMNKVFKATKKSDKIFKQISDWEVVLAVYNEKPDEWKEKQIEDLTSLCDYILFQMQAVAGMVRYLSLGQQNLWEDKFEMLSEFTKRNTELIRKNINDNNG